MSHFIAQLSPIAAKLYLALHLYPDPSANPPIVQITRKRLAADTDMSIRSCSIALRDLIALKLITRLPRRSHQPARFQIHPFPSAQPAAPHQPDAQPAATHSAINAQPAAPDFHANAQPAATNSCITPIPAPITHNAHPAAINSTLSLTPDEEALLANPTFMKLLMDSFTPAEKSQVLASAHATLARLDALESHP